ncbi:hypothetical protein EIP86_005392 [Pleurotus ostreatoroseus]|nr:hypothetical protein EIP86_005392 [Pleurotus ostreatoroseus]
MRRGSQKGKRRDQEAGAPALASDLLLAHDDDHEHCLTLSKLTSISGEPLNIPLSTLSGSADTLFDTAALAQSTSDSDSNSDSDSDYYTDSGSTVLDSHSYLTAQEVISVKTSVKTLSMDPLSDPAPQTSSPPSPAIDESDAESPTHSPADDVEASDHATRSTLSDAEIEETASDAVSESDEPIPSGYDTKDDALLSSPPPVHVQPDIPDPFLIDDDEDSEDDTSSADERMAQSTTPSSAAADDEIALAQSTILEPEPDPATPTQPTYPVSAIISPAPVTSPFPHPALFSPQPNVHKEVLAVPSAPSSEDEEDEEDEEPPELYLPGLVLPTMFLPIPNDACL